MGCSKDGDDKETPVLTLVGGKQAAEDAGVPEGVDKATVQKLSALKQEHRDLDAEILALVTSSAIDQLHLSRLKKRKLMLKDLITKLEDSMLPDIIA